MRRLFVLSVSVTFAVLSCGRTNTSREIRVQVPPIPNGEISYYSVSVGDQPAGMMMMSVASDVFKERPAFRLDLMSRTADGNIETIDSSVVYVTSDSLRPLSSFRFVRVGAALTTTATNYVREAAAIATFAAGEEAQRLLPFDGRTFDSDMLIFLGRAIQLAKDQPVDIKVVNPMGPPAGGGLFEGKIALVGEETVTVPAGTFECSKVLLNLGQYIVVTWYEKTGARRLVRYETPRGDVREVMELLPPPQG